MQPLARPESMVRRVARVLGFYGRAADDLDVIGISRRPGKELRVQGAAIACPICANNRFRKREGKLSTTGLTLFGLDAFNASAVCNVCTRCGHILWFLPQ